MQESIQKLFKLYKIMLRNDMHSNQIFSNRHPISEGTSLYCDSWATEATDIEDWRLRE